MILVYMILFHPWDSVSFVGFCISYLICSAVAVYVRLMCLANACILRNQLGSLNDLATVRIVDIGIEFGSVIFGCSNNSLEDARYFIATRNLHPSKLYRVNISTRLMVLPMVDHTALHIL